MENKFIPASYTSTLIIGKKIESNTKLIINNITNICDTRNVDKIYILNPIIQTRYNIYNKLDQNKIIIFDHFDIHHYHKIIIDKETSLCPDTESIIVADNIDFALNTDNIIFDLLFNSDFHKFTSFISANRMLKQFGYKFYYLSVNYVFYSDISEIDDYKYMQPCFSSIYDTENKFRKTVNNISKKNGFIFRNNFNKTLQYCIYNDTIQEYVCQNIIKFKQDSCESLINKKIIFTQDRRST